MPIKVPNDLPAKKTLESENIFVMTEERALRQDIRALEVAILNLMPNKIETETQLARLLGNTPLQVNLTLLTTETYRPTHVSKEHLGMFYQTWRDVRHKKYDGLIVTGAPVEHLVWEEVTYWDELTRIFDWSKTHVWSSLFVCWAAQAALYYFHGVPKHPLPEKRFGVFWHRALKRDAILLRGFDDKFLVPVSRHTETRREDIEKIRELDVLAESAESGLYIVRHKNHRQLFVFNHCEYDADTLKKEYERDIAKNLPIKIPQNYFPMDDPREPPQVSWRAHANLLFSNWLNYYVYQETPYDLTEIDGSLQRDASATPERQSSCSPFQR